MTNPTPAERTKNILINLICLGALGVAVAGGCSLMNRGSDPKASQVESVDYVQKYKDVLATADPNNLLHKSVRAGSIDGVVDVLVPTASLAQPEAVRKEQALTLWQAWESVYPDTAGLILYSEAGQKLGDVWGGKVKFED